MILNSGWGLAAFGAVPVGSIVTNAPIPVYVPAPGAVWAGHQWGSAQWAGATVIGPFPAIGTQNVNPTGIAALGLGVPTIGSPLRIDLLGIAPLGVGTPTILGSSQNLSIGPGPDPQGCGVPTLAGGLKTLSLYIGGIRMSTVETACAPSYGLSWGSLTLDNQSSGRWKSTFTLEDPTGDWASAPILVSDPTQGLGLTVLIAEDGRTLFNGFLYDLDVESETGTPILRYRCSAVDLSGLCDRRLVTATYNSGEWDIADVVRDVYSKFLKNPDEGLNVGGVPTFLGTLDTTEVFNASTVTQAFDRLALDALATWWVDVEGTIWFAPISTAPVCPFSLTETSKNFAGFHWKASLSGYRNKETVVSNLSQTANGLPTITETFTLPQPEAAARGLRLGTLVLNYNIDSIVAFKVNGVDQPVRNGVDTGVNRDKSWWVLYGQPFIYAPDPALTTPLPPVGFAYYVPTSPFPAIGDVIEISYIGPSSLVSVVGEALRPTIFGSSHLHVAGSGLVEAADQVKDISAPADLKAVAQAILDRNDTVLGTATFGTYTPGAAVGQRITIDLPNHKCPSKVLTITGVSGKSLGNINTGHGTASTFLYQITAQTGIDRGNSMKLFERLIARTEHPLPALQRLEKGFALESGGSLAAASILTNPFLVPFAGKIVEIVGAAGVAPLGQDLLIQLQVNGRDLLASPLVIPAGSLDVITVTNFLVQYVNVNDRVTISATYRVLVTDGSEVNAGSVSINFRWVH